MSLLDMPIPAVTRGRRVEPLGPDESRELVLEEKREEAASYYAANRDEINRRRRVATLAKNGTPDRLRIEDVRAIKALLWAGGMTMEAIAEAHGTTKSVVNNIKRGASWGWVK